RAAALGIVAHNPFEGDHGAVLAADEAIDDFTRVDGLPGERVEVSLSVGDLVCVDVEAAAHRGQEGDFISFRHGGREAGKLLVPGHHDAAGHVAEARKLSGVVVEYGR